MAVRSILIRMLALALVPVLATSCIDDEEPGTARVVVEADPSSPLELVVSSLFDIVVNEETEKRTAVLLTADTVQLTGDYDETVDITAFRRIYVQVRNEDDAPETVRVRVYLDGELFFNSTEELADGRDIEYFYSSHSAR